MTQSRLDAIAAREKHVLGRDLAAALLAIVGTIIAIFLFAQSMRTPMVTGNRGGSAQPAAAHLARARVTPASLPGKVYVAKE